jgi:hypothetical protein
MESPLDRRISKSKRRRIGKKKSTQNHQRGCISLMMDYLLDGKKSIGRLVIERTTKMQLSVLSSPLLAKVYDISC